MGHGSRVYAVIADDLTGAGDTGVQFARAGLRTRALMGEWKDEAVRETDVIVVNTESRGLPPERAYERVAEAAARLRAVGARPVYKKIDSTLRGPVGAKLDAVLDAFGLELAVVCPAFPDNGRAVVGGFLLVGGQPVARTAIGRDPVAPVKESFLPALLAGQTRRPVRHLDLREVEAGPQRLADSLAASRQPGGSVVVVDAATDDDLEVIASAAGQVEGGSVLLVGSAGLARPLARRLAGEGRGQVGAGGAPRPPVLVAVGSVNPVSREQLKRLSERQESELVEIDVAAALRGGPGWQEALARAQARLRAALEKGRTALLTTPAGPGEVEAARTAGEGRGMSAAEVARRVASALAEVAAAALEQESLSGVVVTGGDTARALLDVLGADGIDLVSEVLPGIPLGTVHGGRRPGLRIVTKAGGFGGPEALVQAVGYLTGLP